jgi:short-subunit dehydrogenase
MDSSPATSSDRPVALVTGASSGIGAVFADALAARGYDLILVGRREDRLCDVARRARDGYSVSSDVVVTDLSDRAAVERLADRAAGNVRLEFLVNNAGFGVPGFLAETDPQAQLSMVDVHVAATLRLTAAVLPGMIARGRGSIINVSSLAAFFPTRGNTNYGATKAYLNALTQGLAAELEGTGVRVQALCPGFTRTEFHSRLGIEKEARSAAPPWLWLTAEQVVAESLDGLERNRVVVIPGRRYRWLTRLLRIPPLRWLSGMVRRRKGRSGSGSAESRGD